MKVVACLFAYIVEQETGQISEELVLMGKRSLVWLLEKLEGLADKIVAVASSEEKLNTMRRILLDEGYSDFEEIVENSNTIAKMCLKAISKFEVEDSFLVVPTFSPLIPAEVLELLLDLLEGRDAVFIRDKTGNIYKYLFSIRVSECPTAFEDRWIERGDHMEMPKGLKRTMTISWDAMRTLDPLQLSFFKLRSKSDVPVAERLLAKVMRI